MGRHARVFVLVHVVWSTRARVPLLSPDCDGELATHVTAAATVVGCRVLAIGNASDHVHVVVQLLSSVALSTLVQRLKGATSHDLHITWDAGYFAESIGAADLQTVARYVATQRTHHDDSHRLEMWFREP